MELFAEVFNKASIYDMLFFNVKSVLQYPSLEILNNNNNAVMYDRWVYLAKNNYGVIDDDINNGNVMDKIYLKNAVKYPEFSRIVAITYAKLRSENGEIKRDFKKIVNDDEKIVIETFMHELKYLSSEGAQSTPTYFPTLCGYNIIANDIPLLIKRHILHNVGKNNEDSQIPLIIKRILTAKPWDSTIIDTTNVWKFNGYNHTSLMLISNFLGLKQTVDLLPSDELSLYYWDNIEEKPKETLEYLALQSATQTNLVIQLMNELRKY